MTELFRDALREMIVQIVRDELAAALSRKSHDQITAPYLSTADAAKLAQVAPGTIRRWVREKKLTAHVAGRELRFLKSDLEHLMVREHQVKKAPRQIRDEDELRLKAQLASLC